MTRRRSNGRQGHEVPGALGLATERAFHDAAYEHLIDSVHSRMKDPEWRDFLLRIEEEFATMMLKSIRRERERMEKR